jgi:hypothetical protein
MQRDENLSFEKRFASEALLHVAIAGLLERISSVEGVQILQGTQEFGKDIIFYIKGGFLENILCACVVKNVKITGDAARQAGARTIFIQAQQAFDSPYTDYSGKDIRIERVYVVTPFDIPPATIASIKGLLQERAGQVTFVGWPTLFGLLKTYWPDYLADEKDFFDHLSKTSEAYENENVLADLAAKYFLGDSNTYRRTVYIPQSLQRDIGSHYFGEVLSISNEDRFAAQRLSPRSLGRLLGKLITLGDALRFLHQWDFCNDEQVRQFAFLLSQIREGVERIQTDIEERRQEELDIASARREKEIDSAEDGGDEHWERVTDKTQSEDERHHRNWRGSDARDREEPRVDLEDTLLTIRKALREILTLRRRSLRGLKIALVTQRDIIHARNFDQAHVLSDPLFHYICAIEDCVASSPGGLFCTEESLTIPLQKDLLDSYRNSLLIVGEPGYGKTMFCTWHALQDAQNLRQGRANIIPVYLPLRSLARGPLGSFEDTFLGALGQSALLGSESVGSNIRVRLYLDGLDEVSSPVRRQELLELLKGGTAGSDRFQVILTSRPYIHDKQLERFTRITLGGFNRTEIEELVNKWLDLPEQKQQFWTQLSEMPALGTLIRIPLLAALTLTVYQHTKRLSGSSAKLYGFFVDLLSGGLDSVKGLEREPRFSQSTKLAVLGKLAAELHQGHLSNFSDQDINAAVRHLLLEPLLEYSEELRDTFISDGLVTRSGDVFQFTHLSFQEFLTAKHYLSSPYPEAVNRALENYLTGDDWWKGVLTFYVGLSANPRDIINWLTGQVRPLSQAAYVETIDPAILGLYGAVLEAFPDISLKHLADHIPGVVSSQEAISYLARYQRGSDFGAL